jgi:molybdenum cofactor guanylyltransferase
MLAGGKGTRLGGVDKSRLVIDDEEIGVRTIVTALLAGASEVLAIGGDDRNLATQGWQTVADLWPGEGPLGGLITALRTATNDLVVVVGCDQPDLTAEGLTALVEAIVDSVSPLDVVLTEADGFPHVTHSVWRKEADTQLSAAFAEGARSVKTLLESLRVLSVPTLPSDSISDIDTPADLKARRGPAD